MFSNTFGNTFKSTLLSAALALSLAACGTLSSAPDPVSALPSSPAASALEPVPTAVPASPVSSSPDLSSTAMSDSAPTAQAIEYAKRILNSHNKGTIILSGSSETPGGSPLQAIKDTAAGKKIAVGCGPSTPDCGRFSVLEPQMLAGILNVQARLTKASGSTQTVGISSLGGGGHSSSSDHYQGRAVDFSTLNGAALYDRENGGTQAQENAGTRVYNTCLDVGSDASQTFWRPIRDIPSRIHGNHVHCAFY